MGCGVQTNRHGDEIEIRKWERNREIEIERKTERD